MKKLDHILVVILGITILLSSLSVLATSIDTPEYPIDVEEYKDVLLTSAGLSISEQGLADVRGLTQTRPHTDTINMTLSLQKLTNTGWSTIATWSTSGSSPVAILAHYSVVSGYYYRVKNSSSVYSSSGTWVENVVKYSSIQYY